MKFNARNISVGKNVQMGKNVKLGDNVTICDNVSIGDQTIICNDCVIGEPLNEYYSVNHYENPKTFIGSKSLIRSHAILYAGSVFGDFFQTGHRVTVREYTICGKYCSFGSYNDIQGYCDIGDYCRFHSYVNIGQQSKIGNFVFIYPFTVLTNDPMPPSDHLKGVDIRDFSQIASSVVLLPDCKIGAASLVGANSTVGGHYDSNSFIAGNPARRLGDLNKMPFFSNNKRYYPWPYSFSKNMPWSEIGFEKWKKENGYDTFP